MDPIDALRKALNDSARKDIAWLYGRILFLAAHGSHAYGTNIATSDHDYRGFSVPPTEYWLGYHKAFEQAEFKGEPDMVIFNIKKFFKLAADCNPSIIEILFTDPQHHVIVQDAAQEILQQKDLFLSKKARFTFSGYAIAQLKKIKAHKRWIDGGPQKAPERKDFGLPDTFLVPKNQMDAAFAAVRKQIEAWSVDLTSMDDAVRIALQDQIAQAMAEQNLVESGLWDRAARKVGLDSNFIELMDLERRFAGAMTEWNNYLSWLANRNEKRSELERKWGYDTKHGMHLVRLMRMCAEILQGKGVLVKRPDAEELLAIRGGLWTYDELIAWANAQEKLCEALYLTSPLPRAPDHAVLDRLLVDVVGDYLGWNGP